MTIDRTALRRLHAAFLGEVGPDHLGANLVAAVPLLLGELDAKERRIAELEATIVDLNGLLEFANRKAISDTEKLASIDLRLSIATELNVGDRKRIAELEAQVADTRAQLARAERLLREYGIDPYAGLP